MSDSYFLRPHAGGPALEIKPGERVIGRVLLTTVPGMATPHVVLDPSQVEEVCRVMYRYAGLVWPELAAVDAPCATRFREGECAGTVGHAGECTVNADDIPSEQEQAPPADPSTSLIPGIRSMVRRIETLEQGAADGAATDDMFVAQDKRITMLEERLHELRRAYTAHVDSPQHAEDIVSLLTQIRDRLPEPAPPVCGAPDAFDMHRCDQPDGHTDRHRQGITTWPNHGPRCEELWPHDGVTRCHGRVGHPEKHNAGRVVWDL